MWRGEKRGERRGREREGSREQLEGSRRGDGIHQGAKDDEVVEGSGTQGEAVGQREGRWA
jgi:hypothetical protein